MKKNLKVEGRVSMGEACGISTISLNGNVSCPDNENRVSLETLTINESKIETLILSTDSSNVILDMYIYSPGETVPLNPDINTGASVSTFSAPGLIYYGGQIDQTGNIELLDTVTGSIVASIPLNPTPPARFSRMAVDPCTGYIYASSPSGQLGFSRINPQTGEWEVIGPISGDNWNIAFDTDGTLYAAETFGDTMLYTVDKATGTTTPIGAINRSLSGIAIDPTDGQMYGVQHFFDGPFPSELFKIDKTNGQITETVGDVGLAGAPADLTFDPEGNLYTFSGRFDANALALLDKVNGGATILDSLNLDSFGIGIAWGVPTQTATFEAQPALGPKALTYNFDQTGDWTIKVVWRSATDPLAEGTVNYTIEDNTLPVCGGLSTEGGITVGGNSKFNEDVTIEGTLCAEVTDVRNKVVLDGTEDPFHGWWIRMTKGQQPVIGRGPDDGYGPKFPLMYIDFEGKKPDDVVEAKLYFGPVTDIREGNKLDLGKVRGSSFFQRSSAPFFQTLTFDQGGIADLIEPLPDDPNTLIRIDEDDKFNQRTRVSGMTLQEDGSLLMYINRLQWDVFNLVTPYLNTRLEPRINDQDIELNPPRNFVNYETSDGPQWQEQQHHQYMKVTPELLPLIRNACDLTSKEKTNDPRYMFQYFFQSMMYSGNPQMAREIAFTPDPLNPSESNDLIYVGANKARKVYNEILNKGLTFISDIWKFQVTSNGSGVTTVFTTGENHVQPGSLVLLTGLQNEDGKWSELNNKLFRVGQNNTTNFPFPVETKTDKFVDWDSDPNKSTANYSFIIRNADGTPLDTSNVADYPYSPGEFKFYYPSDGQVTVNHGPIEETTEYADLTSTCYELYNQLYASGKEHTRIYAYYPEDPEGNYKFMYDTFDQLRAGLNSGEAVRIEVMTRSPMAGSSFYRNPYWTIGQRIFGGFPRDKRRLAYNDVNDRYGFLPNIEADRAQYDYSVIKENYLEEVAVLMWGIDYENGPAPSTRAEYATSVMYTPGDQKTGKLCGKVFPYDFDNLDLVDKVGEYIDNSQLGPPVVRELQRRWSYVGGTLPNSIPASQGKGGNTAIGPFGTTLDGTPYEDEGADFHTTNKLNFYFGRIKKSLLGTDKNIGYIYIGDMVMMDSLQMMQRPGTGPADGEFIDGQPNPKWGREAQSKVYSAMMRYLLVDLQCTDGIIFDIRQNDGGFPSTTFSFAEFFGGDRPGYDWYDSLTDDGTGSLIAVDDLEAIDGVLNDQYDHFKNFYVSVNEKLYGEEVILKNAPVIILTNQDSISSGDWFPHNFVGSLPPFPNRDIGNGVTTKIFGSLDGRHWGFAAQAASFVISDCSYFMLGPVQDAIPDSQVTNTVGLTTPMNSAKARFGPDLTTLAPLTGELIAADPLDATTPLVNAADVAGKICLIQRGLINFTDKVLRAQEAGAIAVIVFNNAGDGIFNMIGSAPITIPSVMVGQSNGTELLNLLTGGTQDVSLPQNPFPVTLEIISGAPVSVFDWLMEDGSASTAKHRFSELYVANRNNLVEVDEATYPDPLTGLAGRPPLPDNLDYTVHSDLGFGPFLGKPALPGWPAGPPDKNDFSTWRDSWLEHCIRELDQ